MALLFFFITFAVMKQSNESLSLHAPLVSFIITAYNVPSEFLEECLKAILQLSLNVRDREIILVDDGSEMAAISGLMDYQDDIIYLRQSHQGLSVARNRGIQVATGRYLQFIEGNNYFVQAAYEHCLDLVRYHDPDVVCFQSTDKVVSDVPYTFSQPVSGSAFLHNQDIATSVGQYVFRTSVMRNLRFTPGILNEDEEFTPLLFIRADRVMATDAKALFRRPKEEQTVAQKENKRYVLKRLADMELVIFRLQEKAIHLSATERVALNRRIAQLTMDYLCDAIVSTKSLNYVEEAIQRLRSKGLYPLPDKKYSKKYQLFCKTINSRVGRRLLVLTLPRISS